MTREFQKNATSGALAVLLLLAATAALAAFFIRTVASGEAQQMPMVVLAFPLLVLLWRGLFIVQPNQGKALQLFGRYAGTVRNQGLWWANPFYTKRAISLRVRNFETAKLKVNDHNSNPIEIGAVVVWQVTDTAEALFEVDNYEDYVKVQSESALRGLANQYPV